MPARILDGTMIASDIRSEVAAEVKTLAAAGVRPGLAGTTMALCTRRWARCRCRSSVWRQR